MSFPVSTRRAGSDLGHQRHLRPAQSQQRVGSHLGRDDHHLPVIALGEYRFGLSRSKLHEQLENQLKEWEAVWPVLSVTTETTHHYAHVREQLRSNATPLPENDVWIAALAMQHQLDVASNDDHFDHVEGVRRFGW